MPALARARAVKLKAMGGRLVSARSKTGDPQCSEAMSAWQNQRRGNPASMALDVAMGILGKCRAKARALKQGAAHRSAGNEAKAQALEHRVRSGGPVSAKDRLAKARELRANRKATLMEKQATQDYGRNPALAEAGYAAAKKLRAQHAAKSAHLQQSPEQYQAAKGVHQPWIAEISPYQYSRMGKRQQAAYDKKRAGEWDASAAAKREWAGKVLEDYKAGRVNKDTKGLHADARSVIIGQQIRDKKAAKEAKRKAVDERRVIRSPSELKIGQAIETTMYGKGTVAKINRTSITFRNKQGDVRLPLREGGPAYARRTETPGRTAEVVARARAARQPAKPSLREQAEKARAARQYSDTAGIKHPLTSEHRTQRAAYLRDLRREASGKAPSQRYVNEGQDLKHRLGVAYHEMPASSKHGKAYGLRGQAAAARYKTTASPKPSLREQAADLEAKAASLESAGGSAQPLHAQAMAAANRVPGEKRYGNKVFLHHAWQEYRKGGGKLGLSEFKGGLMQSTEGRMMTARADLVQAMRRGDVKASTATYMGTEKHFIKTAKEGSGAKIKPRPESEYNRKVAPGVAEKTAALVAKVRAAKARGKLKQA